MTENKETDIIYYLQDKINFDESVEEALQIDIRSLGQCIISIRGNEGPIPHFHLTSSAPTRVKGKNGNFECCICLYDALYFNHGNYNDKLDKKQRIKLDKFLRQKAKYITFDATNWELLCAYWIGADNPVINIPKNPKQPNYTDMENMRG